MKLKFEHHTRVDAGPNEVETVYTTLTLQSTHAYSLDQKVRGNIDLEAMARDSNARRILEALYGDLVDECYRVTKVLEAAISDSAQTIIPGTQAAAGQIEEFCTLLRSKLEPGT